MQYNMKIVISWVLSHEGGYSNHPSDPGGPTNYGITIYDYRRYILPKATALDVRSMKLEEAIFIYQSKYWNALRCDDLPSGLDYSMFDYGVNSGIGRPAKVLHHLLGLNDDHYAVDALELSALKHHDPVTLIEDLNSERRIFLRSLKTWPVFGNGWGRRVEEVEARSLKMAGESVVPPSIVPGPARAMESPMFEKIRALQLMLEKAGYDPGAIDGDLGPKTIKAFQRYKRITADGIVGKVTRPLLDQALASIAPLVETH